MKSIFLLLIFFYSALCCELKAQQTLLTGTIIDSETNIPVPFAIILIEGTVMGTAANDSGNFELNLNPDIHEPILLVQALGYKKLRLQLKDMNAISKMTIKLERSAIEMNEIVISGNVKVYKLGSKNKSNLLGSGISSIFDDKRNVFLIQNGLYLKNPVNNKSGRFRNVSFFITNKGFPEASFRIRIYEAIGDSGKPGKDLLQESVIVDAEKGNKWFTVDISKYNVKFPENGCIVAAEWIITDEKFFHETEPGKFKSYGIILGVTKEFKENLFWTYSSEHQWFKFANPDNVYFNPMIKAEVEFVE